MITFSNEDMYLRKHTYVPELGRGNTLRLLSCEVMLAPGFYVFTLSIFCFFEEHL